MSTSTKVLFFKMLFLLIVALCIAVIAFPVIDRYANDGRIMKAVMTTGSQPFQMPEHLEIVEVVEQTTYTGGSVAFVDYSVDSAGRCVIVWHPSRSFSHCDDVNGWQTLYHHQTPAGTNSFAVITRWSEEFAPDNWR